MVALFPSVLQSLPECSGTPINKPHTLTENTKQDEPVERYWRDANIDPRSFRSGNRGCYPEAETKIMIRIKIMNRRRRGRRNGLVRAGVVGYISRPLTEAQEC